MLVEALTGADEDDQYRLEVEEKMRAAFLCPAGQLPRKTGTPWPLDRDPPWIEDPDWQPEDRGPVD